MLSATSPAAATEPQVSAATDKSLICTSITASTIEAFLQEIQEASSTGGCASGWEVVSSKPRLISSCSRVRVCVCVGGGEMAWARRVVAHLRGCMGSSAM
jgi:hypothetical protein